MRGAKDTGRSAVQESFSVYPSMAGRHLPAPPVGSGDPWLPHFRRSGPLRQAMRSGSLGRSRAMEAMGVGVLGFWGFWVFFGVFRGLFGGSKRLLLSERGVKAKLAPSSERSRNRVHLATGGTVCLFFFGSLPRSSVISSKKPSDINTSHTRS